AQVDPSGAVTWPNPSGGDATFTLRVTDPAGAEAWQTWVLSVGAASATNAGVPQITSVPGALAVVGAAWQYQPVAFDSDGDPLLWSLANGPDGMQVDPTGGRVTWTPEADDVGEELVSLVVIDGRGGVARQSWRLQVAATAPDLPPTIVSVPSAVALVGEAYVYAARAVDPELQPLTWTLVEGEGAVDALGRLTWTPAAPGDARFRLEVRDPAGHVGAQAFIVRARGSNVGPVITPPRPQPVVAAGSDWMVDLDAEDADGDRLTWSLIDGPDGVGVGATDGRVRWTPTSDDEGIHSVVVQVADPFGLTDDVEVLLSVVLDAAPPTPILVADVNPACTGDPVRVCAGAVDNVGVARLELRVDGRPAALDDARCVTELRVDPGAVVFDLDVWDPSGNTAHQVLYVDWRSCGGVP
ncbi:MAG TPA: Ig-like domain-containing protein, partial [Myxococcota bacterium]|nr:Ig-like domain-containing protein [Myxococcota bacterium]